MSQTNTKAPKRLFLYTKDVMRITGKGKSASQAFIRKVKIELNKKINKNITVFEFCETQGSKVEDVNLFL